MLWPESMKTLQQNRWRIHFVLGICMLLVGCGKKELPQQQVYPAKGKITWGGEPVRFAMVAFQPVDSTVGVNAFARTEADGSFVLWTYANDEPDGAVPGEYKV